MMRIAIMQPHYLPWAGLFNLVANVDQFVFLDDVQFTRRTWQQRNRILMNGRETMLTVPVKAKGRFSQLINEVRVDNSRRWARKHLGTLESAYARHTHGATVIELLHDCLNPVPEMLVDNNTRIIKAIATALGFTPTFLFSSGVSVSGAKSARLLQICRKLGADTYLSAAGSRGYIEREGLFGESEVAVQYQNFIPQPYPQADITQFVPYLSMVDVLANLGVDGAPEYVRDLVLGPEVEREVTP